MELIFLIIGVGLVIYFTIDFIKSLGEKKDSLLKKVWRWIKNIYDAITGIG